MSLGSSEETLAGIQLYHILCFSCLLISLNDVGRNAKLLPPTFQQCYVERSEGTTSTQEVGVSYIGY